MQHLALRVDGLSKRYRVGEYAADTMLREAIMNAVSGLVRRDRRADNFLWALRDVSFDVRKGEVVGIVGRNGAGKSTLLKLLSRITYATAGRVLVGGRVASLLEVGTGFHDELTGRENIYLNGSILGMRRHEINERLDEIVSFSGIDRLIDTPIKRYSSGMRLRLGFAVAAHLCPDILLVDEVLAVGDADFQKKCLDAMDDLRSSGRTVLFVSHNMAAIESLCSRCIWIEAGRIKADGDARSVVAQYMRTFAMASSRKTELETIESRTGTGEARFTHFEFLNERGEPIDVIRSGDRITMRLHYRADKMLRDLVIGINIHTEYGTLLAASNNWATGNDIPLVDAGRGFADFEVDCLNLLPGRYYLSLWLGKWEHQLDVLKNCIAFDVETADCYGSGRGIESRFGLIYLPSRWRSFAPAESKFLADA